MRTIKKPTTKGGSRKPNMEDFKTSNSTWSKYYDKPLIDFVGKSTLREMQLRHPGKPIKKMFTEIKGKKIYSYIVND